MLPPLTGDRWLTGVSVDLPVLVLVAALAAAYLTGVRRLRHRGTAWSGASTAWFLGGGLGALVLVTCSALGTYERTLFWVLAVQDVLVLTVVPVGLTLGRPVALWRAVRRPARRRLPRGLARVLAFPLVGSVLAVGLLLAVYTTGWDAARLAHPALLQVTRLLLLAAGCAFLWPLLGVDEGTGTTGYPTRALIAFVDGLLDAVPGLAVLGSTHLIAASWYLPLHREWGPTPAADQQLGGTAMIALSELVGLPALLVLLVQWVRRDAQDARDVDAALDVVAEAEAVLATPDPGARQRPWWETDPGPLADRAERYGWGRRDG